MKLFRRVSLLALVYLGILLNAFLAHAEDPVSPTSAPMPERAIEYIDLFPKIVYWQGYIYDSYKGQSQKMVDMALELWERQDKLDQRSGAGRDILLGDLGRDITDSHTRLRIHYHDQNGKRWQRTFRVVTIRLQDTLSKRFSSDVSDPRGILAHLKTSRLYMEVDLEKMKVQVWEPAFGPLKHPKNATLTLDLLDLPSIRSAL